MAVGRWWEPVASVGRRCGRCLGGVVVGQVTAAATVVWAVAAVVALWPAARPRVAGWAVRIADRDLARLGRWYGTWVRADPGAGPRVLYLLARLPVAVVSLVLLFVLGGMASLFAGGLVWDAVTGGASMVDIRMTGVSMHVSSLALGGLFGVGAVLLLWAGTEATGAVEVRLARRLVGPSVHDLMVRRIDELTRTRAEVVRAVDEERRRIERDLHDGVQQRVVALAMLLGRARRGRDPGRTAELVGAAHTEARVLLEELRDVAWRVYPNALDTLGLESALVEVADRCPLPVTVRVREAPVGVPATALYFVAREAITNAVKHSGAGEVIVQVDDAGGVWDLRVLDDGRGGADPTGGGLTGLARRVAALDGTLSVDSPAGGPTTVRAVLPR
ncbi:sensor histidine kinase [Nocardiopsis lambiniae]|uniref:histidine kinase n=1 Tax=Nocardiopsis lambiniae TaxID=3075539 RepID=A0ABU2MDR0_9ACTN|nr:histidine kinase [Nocardiopsis sp. DSM 44743]MDT0330260.1 histidine kinase [Nocardiopsis sp. DSM 44743]